VPSAPFVVPPLLLAALLLISGAAKLRDPADTRSVFTQLQLPAFLNRIKAAELLPFGELLLAGALLLLPGVWYLLATTVAFALFVVYLVVVVRALGFGYALTCGCFGKLGLGWITRQTAIRNAILVAVALIAWLDGWRRDGVVSRVAHLGDGWLWLTATLLAMLTTAFVVREGKPPPYVPPPPGNDYQALPVPYTLVDGPGGPRTLWQLTDEAARMLVFWNPIDADTAVVADRLPEWQRALAPVRVHLVARSEWSQAVAVRPDLADDLLGDPEGQTRQWLRAGMPGAVILGTDRLLAGGPAQGLEEIEELVEAAAEEVRASSVTPDGVLPSSADAVPDPVDQPQ
jgi:hypothetical protein